MQLDLTDMIYALSYSLDQAENSLLGVDTGHGKRVAYLSMLMAKEAGITGEELRDFACCSILHDNALTEYIREELAYSKMNGDVSMPDSPKKKPDMHHFHCVVGEENIHLLPFRTDIDSIVLYHHENADGSGPLKKTAEETPFKAQIVRLADYVDVSSRLAYMTETEFDDLCQRIQVRKGTVFSEQAADLFFKAVTYEDILYLQEEGPLAYMRKEFTHAPREYDQEEVRNIASLFAQIIDYKSSHTMEHSRHVAATAERMARHYGFDERKTIRYYFAGAMHDIGKMVVSNDVLEKPGKLTGSEFNTMKDHAAATRFILSHVHGIDDIIEWAANHHEKLNGRGYPRGLTAEQLTFEDRLMACIDIYQALTEDRPYHTGMSHERAIAIMMDMVRKGELDEQIVQDMDNVLGADSAS